MKNTEQHVKVLDENKVVKVERSSDEVRTQTAKTRKADATVIPKQFLMIFLYHILSTERLCTITVGVMFFEETNSYFMLN